jgi:hypothetical protein
LHSYFQGFLNIIILPPYHFIILYIFFSSAGKNKPYEGATSSAFILGPAPMVSNRKESKHVKRSRRTNGVFKKITPIPGECLTNNQRKGGDAWRPVRVLLEL